MTCLFAKAVISKAVSIQLILFLATTLMFQAAESICNLPTPLVWSCNRTHDCCILVTRLFYIERIQFGLKLIKTTNSPNQDFDQVVSELKRESNCKCA